MVQYTDQLQRALEIRRTPERIISLVPSQTELLIDLGLEEALVGITKFCVHPSRLRQEKQVVGGTKAVKLEKIKSLQPDIILCNKEENTEEMVGALTDIAPVHVSDVQDIEDAVDLIQRYGDIFSVRENAKRIIRGIEAELARFREFSKRQPLRKVAYFIWRKPWMVAGGDTFIDKLLQLNRFENVYQDVARYPEIELSALPDMDYLLLSSEPFPFQEKHRQELAKYVPIEKIRFVDGEYFSWYGSRLEKAFRYFKKWQEVEFPRR